MLDGAFFTKGASHSHTEIVIPDDELAHTLNPDGHTFVRVDT